MLVRSDREGGVGAALVRSLKKGPSSYMLYVARPPPPVTGMIANDIELSLILP